MRTQVVLTGPHFTASYCCYPRHETEQISCSKKNVPNFKCISRYYKKNKSKND